MLNILCKQLLRFCKDTGKFPPFPLKLQNPHIFSRRRRRYQYSALNFKQIKYKRSQNLTSKNRAVKNLKIAKTFSENVNKEAN